jgi:vacuolar-type H+-ATPase subunit F/Vma7
LDYVRAGLQFRLFVAIDFTASNVNARQNLHQISSGQLNDYQRAIRACGDVLAAYSKASQIVATGYGAVVSVDGRPRDTSFFSITLTSSRPTVADVNELLYAYSYALKNVQLSGPTNFTPTIENCVQYAMQPFTSEFQHYNILLIITDGIISDMAKTIDSIVKASDKPLSIIIVGVGGSSSDDDIFEAANVLDGDEQRLTAHTRPSCKERYCPVPCYLFAPAVSISRFGDLREVPDQVLSFFRLHKIQPLQLANDRASTGSTRAMNINHLPHKFSSCHQSTRPHFGWFLLLNRLSRLQTSVSPFHLHPIQAHVPAHQQTSLHSIPISPLCHLQPHYSLKLSSPFHLISFHTIAPDVYCKAYAPVPKRSS